jgi:hypothetical protein
VDFSNTTDLKWLTIPRYLSKIIFASYLSRNRRNIFSKVSLRIFAENAQIDPKTRNNEDLMHLLCDSAQLCYVLLANAENDRKISSIWANSQLLVENVVLQCLVSMY